MQSTTEAAAMPGAAIRNAHGRCRRYFEDYAQAVTAAAQLLEAEPERHQAFVAIDLVSGEHRTVRP